MINTIPITDSNCSYRIFLIIFKIIFKHKSIFILFIDPLAMHFMRQTITSLWSSFTVTYVEYFSVNETEFKQHGEVFE